MASYSHGYSNRGDKHLATTRTLGKAGRYTVATLWTPLVLEGIAPPPASSSSVRIASHYRLPTSPIPVPPATKALTPAIAPNLPLAQAAQTSPVRQETLNRGFSAARIVGQNGPS